MNDYYYIVEEIQFFNGEIIYINLGYVLSQNDANKVNISYDLYVNWIDLNMNELINGTMQVSEYFISTPIVYSANLKTTCIDGLNLSLITDINSLV